MSKKKGIKSNLYWNTLIRIPAQIISFILSILVARILLPLDFGILGIGMMIIGYANIFTNLGLNSAIIQQQIYEEKLINSIFTLDLSISVALTFLIFLAAPNIASFFNYPESVSAIKLLSSVFIITSIEGIPQALLRRDSNFKSLAIFEVSKSLLMSILTLSFALIGLRYWALILGQIIPLAIISIAMSLKTHWIPRLQYKHTMMKNVYNFGSWNFFRSQIEYLVNHIDKIIVGKFLGVSSLGIYDKSVSIAHYPISSIFININSVLFSSFSEKKKYNSELRKLFSKSITLLSMISFPLYTGLIIVAPYFVKGLLGKNWLEMTIPFQILLTAFLFKSFMGTITSLNVGIGVYKQHTKFFFMNSIVFISLCFMAIDYGLIGVSVSFIIFNILLIYFVLNLSLKTINLSWKAVFIALFPSLKNTIIMAFILIAFKYTFQFNNDFINLVISVIIGIVIYLLCLYYDKSKLMVEIKNLMIKDFSKILRKTNT